MGPTEIFKPVFSKSLAIAVWVVLAVIAVSAFAMENSHVRWKTISLVVFLVVAVWVFYFKPEVEISDGGIRIINPFKSVHVPWPAVSELKISGTFEVHDHQNNRYSAYAAPIKNKRNDYGLAGEVKDFAERRLDALIKAGFLKQIKVEGAPVTTSYNVRSIVLLCTTFLCFVLTVFI